MKNILIDKILDDIKISKDKQALLFICKDKEYKATLISDKKNIFRIEKIRYPKYDPPYQISDVEEILLITSNDKNENHEIAFYRLFITTDKGDIFIDFSHLIKLNYKPKNEKLVWLDTISNEWNNTNYETHLS